MAWLKQFTRKQKVWTFISVFIILPTITLVTLYSLVSFELIDDLPSKHELRTMRSPEASTMYAADGEKLGRFFTEDRTNITYADLNQNFIDALIATEDKRFYKHNGVDLKSMGRVAVKTILLRKNTGGGSTLSQQIAKQLYPRKDYPILSTVINKFREINIARRIEKALSKEEVIEMYANVVPFGELAFGIHTASERFFSKTPKDLTLEEAATLVGMLKATTYYSPRLYPERARERRNTVLALMVKNKTLEQGKFVTTSAKPVILDYSPRTSETEYARYFKIEIIKQLADWSKKSKKWNGRKYDINRDGLKIYTTLDFDLQKRAEDNMRKHMADLQRLFDSSWGGNRMFGKSTKMIDEQIKANGIYKTMVKKGSDKEEALQPFIEQDYRNLWTWNGYKKKSVTRIDSIKHYLKMLHAGVFAMDPKTGDVKVWVGGNNYSRFPYDNIKRPRQVGSTFKPIVYLTAIEQGVQPCDYYPNELRTYNDYNKWTPRNAGGQYGGYLSVKGALANSTNTVSVQLMFEAGVPQVVKTAKKMGIKSELSEVPSLVLGTSDITLYEMVQAYTVLANKGSKPDVNMLLRIEDKNENILYDAERKRKKPKNVGIKKESIETLNAMLLNATANGTGRRLYSQFNIPFHVMGKTGTTQNQSDGWFIGYNEDLVVGAWVGALDRRIHFKNLSTGSGSKTALPLVGAVFHEAAKQGLRPEKVAVNSNDFNCYDAITEDEHAYLEQLEEGGFLRQIFNGGGTDKEKISKQRKKKEKKKKNSVGNAVAKSLLDVLKQVEDDKYATEIEQLEELLAELEE